MLSVVWAVTSSLGLCCVRWSSMCAAAEREFPHCSSCSRQKRSRSSAFSAVASLASGANSDLSFLSFLLQRMWSMGRTTRWWCRLIAKWWTPGSSTSKVPQSLRTSESSAETTPTPSTARPPPSQRRPMPSGPLSSPCSSPCDGSREQLACSRSCHQPEPLPWRLLGLLACGHGRDSPLEPLSCAWPCPVAASCPGIRQLSQGRSWGPLQHGGYGPSLLLVHCPELRVVFNVCPCWAAGGGLRSQSRRRGHPLCPGSRRKQCPALSCGCWAWPDIPSPHQSLPRSLPVQPLGRSSSVLGQPSPATQEAAGTPHWPLKHYKATTPLPTPHLPGSPGSCCCLPQLTWLPGWRLGPREVISCSRCICKVWGFWVWDFFSFLVFVCVGFCVCYLILFTANSSPWSSTGPAGVEELLQLRGTQPQHLLLKPHTLSPRHPSLPRQHWQPPEQWGNIPFAPNTGCSQLLPFQSVCGALFTDPTFVSWAPGRSWAQELQDTGAQLGWAASRASALQNDFSMFLHYFFSPVQFAQKMMSFSLPASCLFFMVWALTGSCGVFNY